MLYQYGRFIHALKHHDFGLTKGVKRIWRDFSRILLSFFVIGPRRTLHWQSQ